MLLFYLQVFESTGWIFEEPEIDDTSKFDLMVPSTVRPPPSKDPNPDQVNKVVLRVDVLSLYSYISYFCAVVCSAQQFVQHLYKVSQLQLAIGTSMLNTVIIHMPKRNKQ